MNFDGKALIVNQYYDKFYSENGSAIVGLPDYKIEFNSYKDYSKVIANISKYNENELIDINKSNVFNKLIPYTVQVYNKKSLYESNTLFSSSKIYIQDCVSRFSNLYKPKTVKITDLLLSTNILINEKTAYITDITKSILVKNFPIISANIVDKTEIVIPSPIKEYQDISIVVQKNNFIELKFSDTIIDIQGLPDELEYTLGVIKGTITKSGTYDIKIKYNENFQNLNIVVPYYQRLL